MQDLPTRPTGAVWRCAITVARGAIAAVAVGAVVATPAVAATPPTRRAGHAPIAGSLGVQLRDVPAAEAADPLARLYIIDHVHPGTVIHRLIEVSNTTAATMPILLYPAAATIDDGAFVGAAGHTPNDLSTWTSVSPEASEVPAGGHVIASVTIAVPRQASAGEQYGVVWAETRSASIAGEGITEISRVGVRVYLSVGAGGPPPSSFTIQSLTATRAPDGQPMVLATVHNTGGVALALSGALELTGGPGAVRAGPFQTGSGVTLTIANTKAIDILLDKQLPRGPWDATVTLHSGLITNRARAIITFPNTRTAPPPYLAIIGIALALLATIALTIATTRDRRSPPATPGPGAGDAASRVPRRTARAGAGRR
jgi:hypothetical protein